MNIRPWEERDIDGVARIEKECFPTPLSVTMLQKEFSNPQSVYLVAEENQTVVGYGGFWSVADEAQVMNIAVLPTHRRCGIGQAILKEMCDTAISRKMYSMSLEVRESNRAAIALYEKMGFVVIGERKNYYRDNRETAKIMEKKFEE